MGEGFSGTAPLAPGAPLATTANNVAIVGGTGAFLGARGESGQGMSFAPIRGASITEDPSNRRKIAGGKGQSVIYLIPMERPEIVITSGGPAIFHADFSPITAAKPAKAGEVVIVRATGLVVSKAKAPGAVGCVGTLSRVYRRGGGATLGRALRIGATVLVVTNDAKQVREIYVFAAVLVLESLPFLSAVAIALLENSRANDFAFWRNSAVRTAELIGLRPVSMPAPVPSPQPVVNEIRREAS